MAEFQWWLLIVGLVAGGGLVAVVLMDGARRDADVEDEERRAEAPWIAQWLRSEGRQVSSEDADAVLRAHRDYLMLPPPDRLEPVDMPPPAASRVTAAEAAVVPPQATAPSAGSDPDRPADEVRHDSRGGADQDLASA